MKAASGVIHSEMPQQTNGLMRGFQLWINLPAKEKMSDPAYQEYSKDKIPTVTENGGEIKVICGEYRGTRGPIDDPNTAVTYFDINLNSNGEITIPVPTDQVGFCYLYEGAASVAKENLQTHCLAVLENGDSIRLVAGDAPARLILITGKPLGEPIVQYGPFVMNERQQIEQAFADYHAGTLVRSRASFKTS